MDPDTLTAGDGITSKVDLPCLTSSSDSSLATTSTEDVENTLSAGKEILINSLSRAKRVKDPLTWDQLQSGEVYEYTGTESVLDIVDSAKADITIANLGTRSLSILDVLLTYQLDILPNQIVTFETVDEGNGEFSFVEYIREWIGPQGMQTISGNKTFLGDTTFGSCPASEFSALSDNPRFPNLTPASFASANNQQQIAINAAVGDARYLGKVVELVKSVSAINNTTLTDVMSIPLSETGIYKIQWGTRYIGETAPKYRINYTGTVNWQHGLAFVGNVGTPMAVHTTPINTTYDSSCTYTGSAVARLSTKGTLSLQHAQLSNSATSSDIEAGAYLIAQRISP